jgi:hypothetical protein
VEEIVIQTLKVFEAILKLVLKIAAIIVLFYSFMMARENTPLAMFYLAYSIFILGPKITVVLKKGR